MTSNESRAEPPTEGRPGNSAGEHRSAWDRLGVLASVACAIHCLAAPLIFFLAPSIGAIWSKPYAHALMAVLVLPLAGTVVFRGFRVHRRTWVAAAAVLGSACILVGCALPYLGGGDPALAGELADAEACASCCPQIETSEEGAPSLRWPPASVATMIGSAFLVASHIGNSIFCRCCGQGSRGCAAPLA